MTEALAKVREQLGTDAIILNTRSEKRGGVFDFMGRRMVEVTAAVDDNQPFVPLYYIFRANTGICPYPLHFNLFPYTLSFR